MQGRVMVAAVVMCGVVEVVCRVGWGACPGEAGLRHQARTETGGVLGQLQRR